jgi:hypothetical protein
MLAVRSWICHACGDLHDRDGNAAKNILFAWGCSTSVRGNELSPSAAPPSQASRRCKQGSARARQRHEHQSRIFPRPRAGRNHGGPCGVRWRTRVMFTPHPSQRCRTS